MNIFKKILIKIKKSKNKIKNIINIIIIEQQKHTYMKYPLNVKQLNTFFYDIFKDIIFILIYLKI